jgi:plastocyanin
MKSLQTLLITGSMAVLIVVFTGCSGKEESSPTGTPPTTSTTSSTTDRRATGTTPTATAPAAPTDGTGTVYGIVKFEGTPPKPEPVNLGADQGCAWFYKNNPLLKEDLVLNTDNTVRWTLAYIKSGVKGTFSPPKEAFEVDQKKCVFLPHVSAVMANQPVRFRNSDPVVHNTRANTKINKFFNATQPKQDSYTDHAFEKPEVGIKLVCDVHPWMASYIHVLPHPFFSITGEDGMYIIKGLPPGKYTLEFWHEKLGTKTVDVEAKANELTQSDVTLTL